MRPGLHVRIQTSDGTMDTTQIMCNDSLVPTVVFISLAIVKRIQLDENLLEKARAFDSDLAKPLEY